MDERSSSTTFDNISARDPATDDEYGDRTNDLKPPGRHVIDDSSNGFLNRSFHGHGSIARCRGYVISSICTGYVFSKGASAT